MIEWLVCDILSIELVDLIFFFAIKHVEEEQD
jgi:hypothetical protein